MTLSPSIAIVEDSAEYRRFLIDSIHSRRGWRVVASCATMAEALQGIPTVKPEVVLLDIRLPGGSGISIIPDLKASLPSTAIIMLTVVEDAEKIVEALKAGACGYILKGEVASSLTAGIESVLADGAAISPSVARRIVDWFQSRPESASREEFRLTPREWQVLRLAARGRQQGEIALALGIEVNTVKNHFRHIYEKLHVSSLVDALIKVKRGRGLLD